MWSFSRQFRIGLLVAAMAAPLALAGCSGFTPVYGENGLANAAIELSYAPPNSRLEQVIYQQLALRLGKARRADAPLVTVTASQSSRSVTSNLVSTPASQREMTVTAKVTVTSATAEVVYSATRKASAYYTTGPQVLANQAAETDAAERAAKALAETIRLTLIAALSGPAAAQ